MKNIYIKNKKKIISLAVIILVVGIITITNAIIKGVNETVAFIKNPIPAYAISEISIGDKEYKYNDKVTVDVVKEEIKKQSREFGIDEKFMLDLAFCESSYNNLAENKKSSAEGVYQWLYGSFRGTASGEAHISRFDYKKNIEETMLAIKRGEQWRWEECLK